MTLGTKSRKLLITLAACFLPAVAGVSEETSRQTLTSVSHPDQPSKVIITVSGKDLLHALQAHLEPLRREGLLVTAEEDSVVLTSDTMSEELTELLNKARTLMREHPGRIEIVHKDWSKSSGQMGQRLLPFEGTTLTSQMTAYGGPGFAGGYSGMSRGLDIIVKTPFTGNGYAYAEPDRKHAAELERECHDLAVQYLSSNDETTRAELETKLKGNLNELFDLKLKGFQEKIASIERELDRLRTHLEERKNNKELVVTGRFKELIGEHDQLRW
jgi:hypothetical protein